VVRSAPSSCIDSTKRSVTLFTLRRERRRPLLLATGGSWCRCKCGSKYGSATPVVGQGVEQLLTLAQDPPVGAVAVVVAAAVAVAVALALALAMASWP
jgi:hypothetical protein